MNEYIKAREIKKRKEMQEKKEIIWGSIGILTAIGVIYGLMCLPSLLMNA